MSGYVELGPCQGNKECVNQNEFVRKGPLRDLQSFPVWAQEMAKQCQDIRSKATDHLFWKLFATGALTSEQVRRFLVGFWPVVEQFPRYMAMNLVKAPFGESKGETMARDWLIRNIRVEQNHARYWINWVEAHGICADELSVVRSVPSEITAMSRWCWQVCENDDLAPAMAATNYAIEGITGEWACQIMSFPEYAQSFDDSIRDKALKWLAVHAEYDDEHPWEALEIICTILGNNPSTEQVRHLTNNIKETYTLAYIGLQACLNVPVVNSSGCELAA